MAETAIISTQLQLPPYIAAIIGLFCKRVLSKRLYFEKETHDFKELTDCLDTYGVATISRLLEMIGLFLKIESLL